MGNPEADRQKAMAAAQAMFDRYFLLAAERPKDHIDFDRQVMKDLKLVDATLDGTVTFEFFISQNYSNLNDVMHGGAAGVIFDMATTTALCPVAKPGYWEFMGGVTRSLSISYLKPVPIGITVRLFSKVVSVGKQMAMIRGEMTSLDGKITYCTVEHHKVNTPVLEKNRRVRLPWDDVWDGEWGLGKYRGVSSKI
ncbi:uncharacterized protein EI97DRAFT_228658 [Westerdykella ornata]|uniref:Thioesterase domain-containing protein n=1 Tax=Westerdykella ornata TaxID=318751 RepID=A0A6A6J9F5_WESOR|nr:uncharacterized protein EI97DRAFT_228658 [Westerdykella ornata]KAF2272266.1 hypothetical protein EI97DRAFT_228658 [Westerdykella ornata]